MTGERDGRGDGLREDNKTGGLIHSHRRTDNVTGREEINKCIGRPRMTCCLPWMRLRGRQLGSLAAEHLIRLSLMCLTAFHLVML